MTSRAAGSLPIQPGTHFNIDARATCEIDGEDTVRIRLPEPDGLVLGELRAMHIMSTLPPR